MNSCDKFDGEIFNSSSLRSTAAFWLKRRHHNNKKNLCQFFSKVIISVCFFWQFCRHYHQNYHHHKPNYHFNQKYHLPNFFLLVLMSSLTLLGAQGGERRGGEFVERHRCQILLQPPPKDIIFWQMYICIL